MGRVLGIVVVVMVLVVHLASVLSEAKESQGSCSRGGGSCVDDASSGKDRHARLTGNRKRTNVENSGKTMKNQEHGVKSNKRAKESRNQKENAKDKKRGKGKQHKDKKSKQKKTNKRQNKDKNRRNNPKDKRQEKRTSNKNKTQREKTKENPGETVGKNTEKSKKSQSKDETKPEEQNHENNTESTEGVQSEQTDIKENVTEPEIEGVTDVNESAPLTLPTNPEDMEEGANIPGYNEENEDKSATIHAKVYRPDLTSVDMEFDSAEMDAGPIVSMEATSEQEENNENRRTHEDEGHQGTQEDSVTKKENGKDNSENQVEEENKRTSCETEVKDEADAQQDLHGNAEEEKMGVEENGGERGNEARYLPPVTTEMDSSVMEEETSQSQ